MVDGLTEDELAEPAANGGWTPPAVGLRDEGWILVFEKLLADEQPAAAVDLLEIRLIGLLGRGEHDVVRSLVGKVPVEHRSPLLRAAEADASTRAVALDLGALDALEREVEAEPDLRAFVLAVRSQHLLWRGDPLCLVAAQAGLEILPHDGLTSSLGLFARGRLRMILAIGTLFASFKLREQAEEMIDAAVADFTRAGAVEEAAAAQAYFHTLAAAATWTGVADAAETVGAAAGRLLRRGSPYAPFALVAQALLRFIDGDLWSAWRALDAAEAWDGPTPGVVPHVAAYVKLLARLISDGADEAFDRDALAIVEGLDRHAPELAGGVTLTIGNVLADIGDYERARRWAARARQAPLPLPSDDGDSDALWGRLRIVDGDIDDGIARARQAVESARQAGLGRSAEVMLARVARTLRSVGRSDLASPIRAEAEAGLSAPRMLWEAVLLGPGDTVVGTGAARGQWMIRALAPDLRVEIDGASHPLGRLQARIVGFLLARGRPASIDEVVDGIWPDVDLDAARHRLAMALHRLRASVPLGDDQLVIRERNGLRLARPAEGCRSDVAELMAVDPGDEAAATEVVLRYESDFGERQLAYEDWAIEARRWCRARFVLLATRLLEAALAQQSLTPEAVAMATHVRHAAVQDMALATAVVRTLQAGGRAAEAQAVIGDAERAGVFGPAQLGDLRRLLLEM